jgi:hypothetical protein
VQTNAYLHVFQQKATLVAVSVDDVATYMCLRYLSELPHKLIAAFNEGQDSGDKMQDLISRH